MSTHSANLSTPKRLNLNGSASGVVESGTGEEVAGTIISSRSHYDNLREALTDLYLDVKIRSSDEIDHYNSN